MRTYHGLVTQNQRRWHVRMGKDARNSVVHLFIGQLRERHLKDCK